MGMPVYLDWLSRVPGRLLLGGAVALFLTIIGLASRTSADEPRLRLSKLIESVTGIGRPEDDESLSDIALIGGFGISAGLVVWLAGAIAPHLREFSPIWIARSLFIFPIAIVAKALGVFSSQKKIRELFARSDYENAIAFADKMVRRRPKSVARHLLRATILFYAGRWAEAEQAMRTCFERLQVRVFQNRSRGEESVAVLVPAALEMFGMILAAQNRHEEAIKALKGAAVVVPRYAELYVPLAEAALRKNNLDDAIQLAEKGIQARLRRSVLGLDYYTMANLRVIKARALAMAGRRNEAAAELQEETKAPKCAPALAGLLWRSGLALHAIERESEAIQQFQRAKEIDPHGYYGGLASAESSRRPVFSN
jgi:tetratricopeptide (TPR) repeat protein